MKNGGMFGFPSPARKKQRYGLGYRPKKWALSDEEEENLGFYTSKRIGHFSDKYFSQTEATPYSSFYNRQVHPALRSVAGAAVAGIGIYDNGPPPTQSTGAAMDFGTPISPLAIAFTDDLCDLVTFDGKEDCPYNVRVCYSHNGRTFYNLNTLGKMVGHQYSTAFEVETHIQIPRTSIKARWWGIRIVTGGITQIIHNPSGNYNNSTIGLAVEETEDLKLGWNRVVRYAQNRHMLSTANGLFHAMNTYEVGSMKRPVLGGRGGSQYIGGSNSHTSSTIWYPRDYESLQVHKQYPYSYNGYYYDHMPVLEEAAPPWGTVCRLTRDYINPGYSSYTMVCRGPSFLILKAPNDEYRVVKSTISDPRKYVHGYGSAPKVALLHYNYNTFITHPEMIDSSTGLPSLSGDSPGNMWPAGSLSSCMNCGSNSYHLYHYLMNDAVLDSDKLQWVGTAVNRENSFAVFFRGDDDTCITWGSYAGNGAAERLISVPSIEELGVIFIMGVKYTSGLSVDAYVGGTAWTPWDFQEPYYDDRIVLRVPYGFWVKNTISYNTVDYMYFWIAMKA